MATIKSGNNYGYPSVRLGRKQKIAVLKAARKKLAAPGGWVKGRWHSIKLNKKGEFVDQYCLAGACSAAYAELYPEKSQPGVIGNTMVADHISLQALVAAKTGHSNIPKFNDNKLTKKSDVLAIVDEKIAELESAA